MKKFLLLILPVCLLALTSCNKEENVVDKLVGLYDATRIGNISFTISGTNYSSSMNSSDIATISKLSDSRIRLSYGGDTFDGTVADNHISFESVTSSSSSETATLVLTVSSSGNISEGTINIMETYSGSYYLQGSSFPVTGVGSLVLTR